jgi:hypothetical protein
MEGLKNTKKNLKILLNVLFPLQMKNKNTTQPVARANRGPMGRSGSAFRWSMKGDVLNILKIVSIVFLIAILASCAGVKTRALKIEKDNSTARVMEIMGTPDDRQFSGSHEAWQYGMVVSIGVCDYTVVRFKEGKVTGITSYRNFSTLGCRHGLKSVNWEEASDRIIEMKK